jgi:exodeoxyribonuclease V gamma subunit
MSTVSAESSPGTGLAIVQSNRPEELRQLLIDHIRRHPLGPLEDEIILIQSGGIGRWLQLAMAEDPGDNGLGGGLGISASARFELPARFLWQAYRSVLGQENLPENSPFDADRLRWLVYRELDTAVEREGFEALRHYLAADHEDPRRRFQLAGAIADLFDQYQFFRADWLEDWEAGNDSLQTGRGRHVDLPADQVWQPRLWRMLVQAAGDHGARHRGRLHREFLSALQSGSGRFPELPRRISVFGISSLPHQVMEALAALARHSQVLICLHNPCRYYWGNLVEARDDYRAWSLRHRRKEVSPSKKSPDTEHNRHGNPLLASWGKQGRDFITLLDEMDEPDQYRDWFADRIDLFDDAPKGEDASLLEQIQWGILEMDALPKAEQRRPIGDDERSLKFTIAHSRQREVEILHDHLLAAFDEDDDLQPREIIVMVPDIDDYAPHIDAVFGNFAADEPDGRRDHRYIPYSIGDRNDRTRSGYLLAVERLLDLSSSRFTSAEVLDLLHVPALRRRFGIEEADLELIARWLEGAGIRWGLDATQRERLGLGEGFALNSWDFGLKRMLLAYATGAGDPCTDIVPYDEIAPGTAEIAARLADLVDCLRFWWQQLQQPVSPETWVDRLRQLVDDFLSPKGSEDGMARYQFDQALDNLIEATGQAELDQPLPIEIVRDTLLAELDRNTVSKRFLAGRVNFSTLMPMRAIPFRMVCLLGMNDGDYPRTRKPVDFDLMEHYSRPGDRSRREDDRYLFLEALLSARQQLYISWKGRSVRDNSQAPPSVLVGQLRDHVAAGWRLEPPLPAESGDKPKDPGEQLLEALTVEHPLQPFSRNYFRTDKGGRNAALFTYANEWRALWQSNQVEIAGDPQEHRLPTQWPEDNLGLNDLVAFLRQPADFFLDRRLRVRPTNRSNIGPPPVDEPFALDELQRWQLTGELLDHLMHAEDVESLEDFLEELIERIRLEGRLPLAAFGELAEDKLLENALVLGERYFSIRDTYPFPVNPKWASFRVQVQLEDSASPCEVFFEDWLGGLHTSSRGQHARIVITPSKIADAKKATRANARWEHLARYWPDHLVACALGLESTTILIGRDSEARFEPIPAEQAQEELEALVTQAVLGQSQAFPALPELSGRYLFLQESIDVETDDQGLQGIKGKLRKLYEDEGRQGSKVFPALRNKRIATSRLFPDFEDLWPGREGEHFRQWSERIYGGLVRSQPASQKKKGVQS